MNTKNKPTGTADAWWAMLTAVFKSIQSRPVAWLMSVWTVGLAIVAWHVIDPASWDAVWGAVTKAISPPRHLNGSREQAAATWLREIGRWGQIVLYASSALLALYVCYALWVWRQYRQVWMPEVRMERLRGGQVLEVIIPSGSKADARAAADMFGQIGKLLSDRARTGGARSTGGSKLHSPTGSRSRRGNIEAERLALSLEMWSTPHSGGKVGFYIWCPKTDAGQQIYGRKGRNGVKGSKELRDRFTEEIRHMVMVHHPRCRVRWVEDPVKRAIAELTQVNAGVGQSETGAVTEKSATSDRTAVMTWYELTLRADSRYPIGSGAAGERLSTGTRALNRPGAPGAGSDPLAAVIGMLGSDKELPVMGLQIVAAAHPDRVGEVQQAVSKELARLRDIEMQAGKKALDPQHEARVLALEEKADRQGYDVAIRLMAVEVVETGESIESGNTLASVGSTRQQGHTGGEGSASAYGGKAEARLESLLRIFKQYDRTVAGVSQGFEVARIEQVSLNASGTSADLGSPTSVDILRRLAPLVGRWTREGVGLPRLLPFMKAGKPVVLNTLELSSIYHFPHQGLEGLASLRWKNYRQIAPPAMTHVTKEQLAKGQQIVLGVLDDDLAPEEKDANTGKNGQAYSPRYETDPTGIWTPGIPEAPEASVRTSPGTNVLPPGIRGVGTYFEDLRRGTYVLGPMGSGKSVFLYNVITQYMSAGRGVGIIDGKGDSYWDVLQLVPPHLEGEVLTFDPENRARGGPGGSRSIGLRRGGGGGGGGGRSIGINPLDGRVAAQFGAEKVESLTMSLMRKMMGASWETAVLMQRYLRDAIIAVLQAEPSPTMLNLWRWLQDDGKGGNEYREARLGGISNKLVQDFWQRQVQGMSSQQRSSMQNVLTRVDRYVKNDVRYLLLQPYSTVNFREIMDKGTIFVGNVSPRLGEDQSFLGAMVLNGFLTGAFARQPIPKEQRRDYLLVVDEFQNFVDTASADMERMLSMARGYRLGLMLAHQYTDQLPKEVLSAILKNVQTWAVFGLQADDARRFSSYMEGLEAQDFQNLPPYYTYQRTVVKDHATGVYSAAPLNPPTPAANPGEECVGNVRAELKDWSVREALERKKEEFEEFEELRLEGASGHLLKLVKGEPEESDQARRARTIELATQLYWPAEEGDPEAVRILSTLSTPDFELYKWVRRNVLDKEQREFLLAHPQRIPDKAERIERLSALRWGTPCAEVDALVLATLSGRVEGYNGSGGAVGTDVSGSTSKNGTTYSGEPAGNRREKLNLLPDFTDLEGQQSGHH